MLDILHMLCFPHKTALPPCVLLTVWWFGGWLFQFTFSYYANNISYLIVTWDIIPANEIWVFNFIRKCQRAFQSGLLFFTFIRNVWEFQLLHILANTWYCWSLILAFLVNLKWYLIMVMTNDVKHFLNILFWPFRYLILWNNQFWTIRTSLHTVRNST